MTFSLIPCLNEQHYNSLIQKTNSHLLQSWLWGEVKKPAWIPKRYIIQHGSHEIGIVSVLLKKYPFLPVYVGYIPRAFRFLQKIENEERIVVGQNRFQVEEEKPGGLLRVDPSVRVLQSDRLRDLRAKRDNEKVEKSLKELKTTAEGYGNLMYPIIEAVKAYATLGEICDVLREVFGEYQQATKL